MVRVLTLMMALSVLHPAQATGGYCAGDEAKAAKILEFFSFQLDRLLDRLLRSGEAWIDRVHTGAGSTALWQLQWDSKNALHETLTSGTATPDRIRACLAPFLEKASSFLEVAPTEPLWDPRSSLDRVVIDVVGAMSVCQAINAGDPAPCQALSPIDLKDMADCRLLMVRLGLTYRHRCGEQEMLLASRLVSQPPELLQTWCLALHPETQGQIDLSTLGDVLDTPGERATVRALLGEGVRACRTPELSNTDQERCVGELDTFLFVTRRILPGSWEPKEEKPMYQVAALAAREPTADCTGLTLWAFERSSTVAFRLLDLGWATLPGWLRGAWLP